MQPNIELQKPRDFGEIINDTFIFIRQNIKPLLKYFFIFCGFFVVAIAVTSILQALKMLSITNAGADSFVNNSRFAQFGIEYFLNLFFVLLGYTAISVTVFCYVALYKIKGNIAPDTEEMWGYFKFYYLKSLLYCLLLGILLIAGLVFCLIPGIYLYPIFALVLPIMIIENTTFGYAFNHSFKLIKDNWWATFGALLIIFIIVSVARVIFILPSILVNAGSLLFHLSTNKISVAVVILVNVIQQIATVFQIIPVVTICLCYFNLTESKEGTGLLDRIKNFGTGNPGENITPEEY